MKISVEDIEYHRNGTGGEGFYVVLFRWLDEDDPTHVRRRRMMAVVHPSTDSDGLEQDKRTGYCSVLDRDALAAGDLTEKFNADYFEPALRTVLAARDRVLHDEACGVHPKPTVPRNWNVQ